MDVSDLGERLRGKGWRQGVILPAADLIEKLPDGNPPSDDHWLLAASQSCDLLHGDLEKEPHAVFLVLLSRESEKSEFTGGRNPRVLHFSSVCGKAFAASAWNQIPVPRQRLADVNAGTEVQLDRRTLRIVLEWLAKRFTRIAFPDDFNGALQQEQGNIRKILKRNHRLFTEILLRLEPFTDLRDEVTYELACYLLMEDAVYRDRQAVEKANQAATGLEKAFSACGIEVLECSPVSENDLTVAELKELVRWDYDYLTHRDA